MPGANALGHCNGKVVAELLNKQIAGALGISQTTVKIHRHQVMEKMKAASLAELVRMADRLTVCPGKP
jgi:FixJ family two-component response regulator